MGLKFHTPYIIGIDDFSSYLTKSHLLSISRLTVRVCARKEGSALFSEKICRGSGFYSGTKFSQAIPESIILYTYSQVKSSMERTYELPRVSPDIVL